MTTVHGANNFKQTPQSRLGVFPETPNWISISSRSTRPKDRNSRSRLEAWDQMTEILDLVSEHETERQKFSVSSRSMIPKDRKSRSRLESWKMHLAMLCLTPPGDPSHFIPLIAYVPAFLSHHLTLMVVPWWLSDTYFNLVQVKDSAAGKSHLASCSTKNAVQTPCSLCALHSCLLLQSLQTHALLVNLIDGRGVVGRHHWFKNCKWFLLHHSSLGKPSWKHCYYQFKH